jgi:hypothetical protein
MTSRGLKAGGWPIDVIEAAAMRYGGVVAVDVATSDL